MKKVPGSFWLLVASVIGAWHLTVLAKEINCNNFLSVDEQNKNLTSTQGFIAYLSHLFEIEIISEEDLAELAGMINLQKKIINIVPHRVTQHGVTFTHSSHKIHYETLETLIKQANLNHPQILDWITNGLKRRQQVRQAKQKNENETISPYVEMKFHRVKKGNFLMGEDRVPVELTHDFEVMSTPVTQWMWVKELAENYHYYYWQNDIPGQIVLNIKGNKVRLHPDHPVQAITWYAAALFANYMSRKHGLKEVYDFSEVQFSALSKAKIQNGQFGDGIVVIESGDVKINGPNIYETEGYRLPTEAEQEFLLTDRGRSTTEYFSGVTKENIAEYARIEIDNYAYPDSVGAKKALSIDGNNFYDLYGNVAEWSHDRAGILDKETYEYEKIRGGKNPSVERGRAYIQKGGYDFYGSDRGVAKATFRFETSPTDNEMNGEENVGFRLVRTVK